MRIRSLPHFSHKPIGKTTHKKGMSYAHVNYITRDEACSKTLAGNMPADRDGARPFFEREANKEGVAANARIADTLIIALPLEMTHEQRWQAIENFMERIGKGRIPWIAAFHDQGKDEHNPHCHLIFRDADIETGRKVVGTTTSAKDVKEAVEHGWKVPPRMTTHDLRVAWCEQLNCEMERHGIDVRFDHRKLKDRGIDREPEIHVGPKAHSMTAKDREFESQDRKRGNHANVYSLLDAGSRAEYNERIRAENRERAAKPANDHRPRSRDMDREAIEKRELRERQSLERKAMYADQAQDRGILRQAQHAQKLEHQRRGRKLYAEAREKAFQEVKKQNETAWAGIRKIRGKQEREAAALDLKAKQKVLFAEVSANQIAEVRPVKDAAWQTLKLDQEKERQNLQQRHLEEAAALSRQHISERHAVHEKWRDHHQQKEAIRSEAQLTAHQDMPTVQAKALETIKQRIKTRLRQTANGHSATTTPLEARQLFAERAKAEGIARGVIRYQLNATRRLNSERAGPWLHAKVSRMRSREETDKQSAIKRAARSGQVFSSAERASASPSLKAAIARSDRTRQSRRDARFLRIIQQERAGKGRDGGGRSGR